MGRADSTYPHPDQWTIRNSPGRLPLDKIGVRQRNNVRTEAPEGRRTQLYQELGGQDREGTPMESHRGKPGIRDRH